MVTTARDSKLALKEQVRRSLPTVTLEQIRIASPYKASWESMTGDEKTRHCGQCDKDVHDLSAMTRAEAEALVTSGQAGRMCVKMWVRPDGTVLTADCPVGLARVRQGLRRVGALFGALLGSLGWLVGCTPPAEVVGAPATPPAPRHTGQGEPREVMGDFYEPPAAVQSTTAAEVASGRDQAPHEVMGRMVCEPDDSPPTAPTLER